jgi:hypothetical protein
MSANGTSDQPFEAIWPVPNGTDPTFRHFQLGKPSATWKYVDSEGQLIGYIARFETPDGKEIRPYVYGRRNEHTGWEWVGFPEPRPLYGLDRLADRPNAPVLVVEGEKTADAATKLAPDHVVVTWPGGAAAIGKADWTPLQGRQVVIWPDNDNPGRKAAAQVAKTLRGIATDVRIVGRKAGLPEGWDLADPMPKWARIDVKKHIETAAPALPDAEDINVDELIARARTDRGAPFEPAVVDYLARLEREDPAEFERLRERLKGVGIRVSRLDEEIARHEPGPGVDLRGGSLTWAEIEPWPHPVNGAELLDAMALHLARFAIMPPAGNTATVLWALHSHALDAAIHTPRLLITSPTPECGKGQVITWLGGVVPRPFEVIDPTGPTLFRPIELYCPTVLLDEGDLLSWDDRRDILAVVQAGHTRTSQGIPRCVGDDNDVRVFHVWAPFAYAMIRKPRTWLPATMISRSIIIPMEWMRPDDPQPEHRRYDRDQGFGEIQQKCARWANDHLEALRGSDPKLPMVGRRADCWRPLFAIAEAAGGDWPKRTRDAALMLSASEGDEQVEGAELLTDIKAIWPKRTPRMATERLLHLLHQLPERPWGEHGRSREPISAVGLAALLKPFRIKPGQLWIDGRNQRGFERNQFVAAWERYVLPEKDR